MPELNLSNDILLKESKRLWVSANVALEQGRIKDYFKHVDELFQFMADNRLESKNLIPILDKVFITPSSYSRLQAIHNATLEYGLGTATEKESKIEAGLVSSVRKRNSFFMDCKMKPNQRAETNPDLVVSKRDILVDIMSHMKNVVSPETFIRGVPANVLLENKIEALMSLDSDVFDIHKNDPKKENKEISLNKLLDTVYAAKHKGMVFAPETANITFQTPVFSTLKIASPNTGQSNPEQDWSRVATTNKVFVNGVALSDIAKAYNQFKCEDDLKSFFDEIILKDFVGTDEQKKQAVDYLTKSFHQGGLLYPVSSALATSFVTTDGVGIIPTPTRQKVNIQTSITGFLVQELCSSSTMFLDDPDNTLKLKKLANSDGQIKNKDESEEIIVAEGTVSVDFSITPKEPSLTIVSSKIEVKHSNSNLIRIFEKRHWLEKWLNKIIDYFKKSPVDNIVPEIAPKKPDASIVDKITNIKKSKDAKRLVSELKDGDDLDKSKIVDNLPKP